MVTILAPFLFIVLLMTGMLVHSSLTIPRPPEFAGAVEATVEIVKSRARRRDVAQFEQADRIHVVHCETVPELCAELDRRKASIPAVRVRYVDTGIFGGDWILAAHTGGTAWAAADKQQMRYRQMLRWYDGLALGMAGALALGGGILLHRSRRR